MRICLVLLICEPFVKKKKTNKKKQNLNEQGECLHGGVKGYFQSVTYFLLKFTIKISVHYNIHKVKFVRNLITFRLAQSVEA